MKPEQLQQQCRDVHSQLQGLQCVVVAAESLNPMRLQAGRGEEGLGCALSRAATEAAAGV